MKRALTLAATLLMIVAVTVPASAEMVNAGLVQMEKAEVEYLKELVSAGPTFVRQSPAAEKKAAEDLGLVDISAADLADIRGYVSGRTAFIAATGHDAGDAMVTAGTVEMAESDLAALKQMVSQGHTQRLAHLSSALNN